jgi:O-antigen ligase
MGMGNTKQVEQISQKMGIRVGSHNGFIDAVLTTGILGLFSLFYYLYLVYKVSRENKNEYAILYFIIVICIHCNDIFSR